MERIQKNLRFQMLGLALVLFFLSFGFIGSPQADSTGEVDVSQAPFASFLKLVGTYQHEEVLSYPGVSSALSQTLGDHEQHLLRNLELSTSIGMNETAIFWEGLAVDHSRGMERAILAINIWTGKTHAAIFSQGKVQLFSPAQFYPEIPLVIKDWVAVMNNPHDVRRKMPPGVHWNRP